jgi:hypothetical protein
VSSGYMSIADSVNYVRHWIQTCCPLCQTQYRNEYTTRNWYCDHTVPRMQIRGLRGITISFSHTHPSLTTLGMRENNLYTGLRHLTELIAAKKSGIFVYDQDLYLELDNREAVAEAEAYGMMNDHEEEIHFLNRRLHVKQWFLRRDVYHQELTPKENPGPNTCNNCGRGVDRRSSWLYFGNRAFGSGCKRCEQMMCTGCANDGVNCMDMECYACQHRYRPLDFR